MQPVTSATASLPLTAPVPPPPTAETATTAITTVPDGPIAVSYLEPPPLYEPHPFAILDQKISGYVALGDGYAVVGDVDANSDSGELVIVPTDAREITSVPVQRVPGNFVVGPGPVVYGEVLDWVNGEDLGPRPFFVAIALEGEHTGSEILVMDGLAHALDGWGPYYALAPDGVIDRWHSDVIMTPYLDPLGNPLQDRDREWAVVDCKQLTFPEPSDAPRTYEVTDGSTAWRFAIHRDPTASGQDETRAWPGRNGSMVFTTAIGPRIGDDPDYGTPTIRVVGVMHPAIGIVWRQLPEGWHVVDSNRWGTLLARSISGQIELAINEATS
jgi:hypothetical protein